MELEKKLDEPEYVITNQDSDKQIQEKWEKIATIHQEITSKIEVYDQFVYLPKTTRYLVHLDMSGFIHTWVFINNYDISYGYISCAINSEDMNNVYDNADYTKRKQPEDKGATAPAPGTSSQEPSLNTDEMTEEEKKKCRYAKELLRTIASCFDTPVWGTCTGEHVDAQCLMPNHRCTPDCVVTVVPENIVDLRYPIFIMKVHSFIWMKAVMV